MLLLAYLLLRGRENSRVWFRRILLGGMVAVLVVGTIAGGSLLRKVAFSTENLSRVQIWKTSFQAIARSPLLGWGMGNYTEVFAQQQETFLLPNDKAHSTPIDVVVEMGIPGGIVAISLVLIPWWVCLRSALRRRRRDQYIAAAACAVVAVPMLHSTVDFSLQIPCIGFMTSALLGLGWAHSFPQDDREREDFTEAL